MSTPSGSHRPVLIAMAGLPGTGKSTCADLIAQRFHIPIIDKDDLLELVRRSSIEDELEQGRLAYDLAFSLAERQLQNGADVIVDTCLAFAWLRTKLTRIAAAHRAEVLVVNCVCDDKTARERIAARSADGLPHRNVAEYDRLQTVFEDFATRPDLTIDTAAGLADVPAKVGEAIDRARTPASAPLNVRL